MSTSMCGRGWGGLGWGVDVYHVVLERGRGEMENDGLLGLGMVGL